VGWTSADRCSYLMAAGRHPTRNLPTKMAEKKKKKKKKKRYK